MKTLYRSISQAMLTKDTALIERVTTDDFKLIHITGYEQSKAEWLEHIATDRMQYHQVREVSVEVNVNGKRADIVGRSHVTATIWGSKGTWPLESHYTAIKENGQWRMQKASAKLF